MLINYSVTLGFRKQHFVVKFDSLLIRFVCVLTLVDICRAESYLKKVKTIRICNKPLNCNSFKCSKLASSPSLFIKGGCSVHCWAFLWLSWSWSIGAGSCARRRCRERPNFIWHLVPACWTAGGCVESSWVDWWSAQEFWMWAVVGSDGEPQCLVRVPVQSSKMVKL